jgi:hypothetical protein
MAPVPQPQPVQSSIQQQQQHQLSHQTASSSDRTNPMRKEYSTNFWENYEHVCSIQNQMPMQSLKSGLSIEGGAVLNLNADKFK